MSTPMSDPLTPEERAAEIMFLMWGDRTTEPDMQEMIASAIRAAVEAEREAIAMVEVEAHMVHPHYNLNACATCAILSATADRIRARSVPAPKEPADEQ